MTPLTVFLWLKLNIFCTLFCSLWTCNCRLEIKYKYFRSWKCTTFSFTQKSFVFKFLKITISFLNAAFNVHLTLIWVDFLGVLFEVWGGGKITLPVLKLVRILLETWTLARKYTRICSFRKYFFGKNSFLKAIVWEMCYRLFASVFSFDNFFASFGNM